MKLRILASAAVLGLLAAPAYAADSASDTITIIGNQDKVCVLTVTTTGAEIDLLELDGTAANAIAAAGLIGSNSYGDSYCNVAHSIELKSANGGLVSTGTTVVGASDLFDTHVLYTATLSNWFDDLVLTTTGVPADDVETLVVAGAFRNDADPGVGGNTNDGLEIEVATLAGVNPLLQGEYEDELTLTLTATP